MHQAAATGKSAVRGCGDFTAPAREGADDARAHGHGEFAVDPHGFVPHAVQVETWQGMFDGAHGVVDGKKPKARGGRGCIRLGWPLGGAEASRRKVFAQVRSAHPQISAKRIETPPNLGRRKAR